MWERRAAGTYYEMGQEMGRLMRAQNYRAFTGEDLPFLQAEGKLAFAEACRDAVEAHAPELLEELAGMLDGGGFTFETLGVLELSLSAGAGCTLMAIAGEHTTDGSPILARSYDFFEWSVADLSGAWSDPQGGLASLGFTDIGLGRYGGANEAGLAMATTMVNPGETAPGVINYLATRWILDNCWRTEEAVAYLQEIPHVWGVNHLLIDGHGTIAAVESHPRRTRARYVEGGFAAVTNHFLSAEMADCQAAVHPDSLARLDYVNAWFRDRGGPVSVEDVMAVQRDHAHGVCVHAEGQMGRFCTCWAWIARATEGRMEVCQGSPCENEYGVYSF